MPAKQAHPIIAKGGEMEAIRFLRTLVGRVAGRTREGKADPGWCCSEHAVIATLAFTMLGVKASLCRGAVMIGGEGVLQEAEPHDFVFLEERRKIFDSSVTHGGIAGIPCAFALAYPELGMGVVEGKPEREDFIRSHGAAGKKFFALYAVESRGLPKPGMAEWRSETPFGNWLSARYGSQEGLWEKAARFTAAHLLGDAVVPREFSREELWDIIAGSQGVGGNDE